MRTFIFAVVLAIISLYSEAQIVKKADLLNKVSRTMSMVRSFLNQNSTNANDTGPAIASSTEKENVATIVSAPSANASPAEKKTAAPIVSPSVNATSPAATLPEKKTAAPIVSPSVNETDSSNKTSTQSFKRN